MSRVAVPADRRFRRAHVKPSRKRGPWRALLLPALKHALLAVVAVYGVYRAGQVVATARALQVDRIVVQGNEHLEDGQLLAMLNGLRGEHIVWTDLAAWRLRVLSSPWVRDAAIRRSLPSTVEVTVWERQPVAIARIRNELYLVDEGGVVIDQHGPQYAEFDLPIVDGLATSAEEAGTTDAARAELAAKVIAAVRDHEVLAERLSQIDVSDPRNVAVVLSGDPAILRLGDEAFLERLQSYLELAPALRERVPEIDTVDLRFDDRIYVRPAGRGNRPEAIRTSRNGGGRR